MIEHAAQDGSGEPDLFRLLAENARDYAIFVIDGARRVQTWSPAAERLLGYSEREILGRSADLFFTDEDRRTGQPEREVQRALELGRGEDDRWHLRKDGSRFWSAGVLTPLRDAAGQMRGFCKIMRDQTALHQAEVARLEAQEQLRILADNLPRGAVYRAVRDPGDGPTRFTYMSAGVERMFGVSADEAVADSSAIYGMIHPDDLPGVIEAEAEAARDRKPFDRRFRHYTRSGELIHVHCRSAPRHLADGRLVWEGVVLDVTDQVRAEERRRESDERFRSLMDQAPFSIQILDTRGRTLRVNQAWQELWGASFEQISDYNVLKDPQLEAKGIAPGIRRAFAGEPAFLPLIEYDPNETLQGRIDRSESARWVSAVAYPLKDSAGQVHEVVLVHEDVTAKTVAEKAVRRQAEMLSAILSASVDNIYVVDRDGRYRLVSEGGARFLGFAPEQMIGRHWTELGLPADVMERFDAVRVSVLRSGVPTREEVFFQPPDDAGRNFEYVVTPLRNEAGESDAVVVVSRDVTDRRRIEKLLDRYRLLSEFTRDIILFVGWDGAIVEANAAAMHAYGYDRETLLSMNISTLREPSTHPQLASQLAQAAESGIVFETLHRRRDGAAFPVEVSSRGADVDGGRLLLSVIRDVTDRRRADEELRRRTTLLKSITDNADSALVVADAAGRLTFVNPAFTRLTGYRPEEALGRSAHELVHWKHPDGREFPAAECLLDQAYRTSQVPIRFHEDIFVRKDGSVFPVVVSLAPLEEAGAVVGCVAEFRDVTVTKQAEAALVRNEQVSRFLADAGAALADITDRERTLAKVASLAVPRFADWCAIDLFENGAFRRAAVVHRDKDKIDLAHEYHRRFPPSPEAPQGLWRVLRTGESELVREITDELIDSAPEPEQRETLRRLGLKSYIAVPLKVRDETLGVITFVAAESGRRFDEHDLAMAEDLARRTAVAIENVRLYEGLRDADRRKNEFLAMLGHELRNPLAPIRTGLDLLKMEGASPDIVELMGEQVEHVVRLVDDLLDVSRILRGRVELKRQVVELTSVIQRSCEIVRPLCDAQQQDLVVSLPGEPIRIEADAVRLTQVLANLLNNAAKYSEPGSRISLSAERQGGEVLLLVTDTGMGIERHLLPHVFDLFTQSTRTLDRAQGGLGLGLTIVRNLIEMHGGTVTAESEGEGRGSRFTVRLPISDSAGESPKAEVTDDAPERRTILVVDDNVPAAKLLVRLLGKLGKHEIVTAHEGAGALKAAEAYRPDLILLDIGLPGMDGFEVARRLRENAALTQTQIVALTGYGSQEDRRRSAEAGFDEHITKPPSIETLREVLRRL